VVQLLGLLLGHGLLPLLLFIGQLLLGAAAALQLAVPAAVAPSGRPVSPATPPVPAAWRLLL